VYFLSDHKQLPPTIKSAAAASAGLSVTMFDRLLGVKAGTSAAATPKSASASSVAASAPSEAGIGSGMMRMLTVQYRMHRDIMKWASDELYESKLTAPDEVAQHLLCDLPHVSKTDDTTVSSDVLCARCTRFASPSLPCATGPVCDD
jgi:superfamily I DNA and/or RNA helicase